MNIGNAATLVIDYGMGNLASVKRALEECGTNVFISSDPSSLKTAAKILLPGVGSFTMAMENIQKSGWQDALNEAVMIKKIPILGICLGMQLLASGGTEHGNTKGLGYIRGQVKKIDISGLRVPHIGWNEIKKTRDCELLAGVESGTDFYFVHSYYFAVSNDINTIATTPYGFDFPSVIADNNIWGTQFHPEKSGMAGFQILKNFIAA